VLIEPILRDSATEIARYTYPKKFGTRLSGGAPLLRPRLSRPRPRHAKEAERMSMETANKDRPVFRRLLRSTGAVLLGLLAVIVLSIGTDQVFHSLGIYPPWGEPMSTGQYLLALAYRIAYAVFGSYLAARFAPGRPMLHAMTLGAIGLVLSVAGAAAMWHLGDHWYPIALALTALPCAWAGGALYASKRS
jgi:hypothetical protein